MRRGKTWIALLLCLLLALGMSACGQKEDTAKAAAAESESTQAVQETKAAKETKKKETQKKESKKEETKKKTTKATEKSSTKSGTKAVRTSDSSKKEIQKKESKKKTNAKPSGHVLTIKKGDKKVYFTESQLKDMGTATYKYSFRNKDSSHRQFINCTGVKFSKIISKSGLSGSTARIRSTDGYTKEFSVSELKSNKKAFLKKTGSSSKSVPAIITTSGSESFRLCFGQAGDDTDDNGDYNAQYWVKNIDSIELF